jgi:PPM family protein phosphatase
MRFRVGSGTDIGRLRRRNEDSYLVKEPLFVVADGMGGHRGGDVASRMAVDIVEPAAVEVGDEGLPPLIERIKQANREVMQRGEADRDLRGMGTTLTAIVTGEGRAHVAHIGDSRAYLLRDEVLQQLTEDHTLVQKMVREGRLTEEEAARHPQRSVLLRVLGVEEDLPVDELTLDLHPGDRLLLCSDGLSNMLDREHIARILREEPDPQTAADRLIEEANREGGDDNITVIVVDVVDGDGQGEGGDGERRGSQSSGTRVSDGAGMWDRPGGGSGTATARATATATLAGPRVGQERETKAPAARRVRWRRSAAWLGGAAVVVLVALVGTRLYVDRQWYVGDSNGYVAVYNGIPATILGFDLHHVVEVSPVSSVQAEQLRIYQDLSSGITASSLVDARSIVQQICLDVAATTGDPTARTPMCSALSPGAGG